MMISISIRCTALHWLSRAIAWCSDGKFLRSYLDWFLVDARPTPRLTLDAVEDKSNWWVSSREYFDGLICEPSVISSSVNLHSRDDPTVEVYRLLEEQDSVEEHEISDEYLTDGYLTEKEQQQLLLDEKGLRETLEEKARAEKEWEERIKQEQDHDDLFGLEFEVKSDSEYESD
nr:hypothetical protein [Tanacetum cinerariifolium]